MQCLNVLPSLRQAGHLKPSAVRLVFYNVHVVDCCQVSEAKRPFRRAILLNQYVMATQAGTRRLLFGLRPVMPIAETLDANGQGRDILGPSNRF